MRVVTRWLKVNSDGDVVVTKLRPHLRYNEVRYRLELEIPVRQMDAGEIALHLPEMPVPVLAFDEPQGPGE